MVQYFVSKSVFPVTKEIVRLTFGAVDIINVGHESIRWRTFEFFLRHFALHVDIHFIRTFGRK